MELSLKQAKLVPTCGRERDSKPRRLGYCTEIIPLYTKSRSPRINRDKKIVSQEVVLALIVWALRELNYNSLTITPNLSSDPTMVGHPKTLAHFLSNLHQIKYMDSSTMCEHDPGGFE